MEIKIWNQKDLQELHCISLEMTAHQRDLSSFFAGKFVGVYGLEKSDCFGEKCAMIGPGGCICECVFRVGKILAQDANKGPFCHIADGIDLKTEAARMWC